MNESKGLITARVFKIIFLFCIVLFLFFSLKTPSNSNQTFEALHADTIANIDVSSLVQQDNIAIKKFLKIEPEKYENIVYYKTSNPLGADEIVLVKFKSDKDHNEFEKAIQDRVKEQENVFSGYAPEEEEKLKKALIDLQANYGIYVVSNECDKFHTQFLESLKKESGITQNNDNVEQKGSEQ